MFSVVHIVLHTISLRFHRHLSVFHMDYAALLLNVGIELSLHLLLDYFLQRLLRTAFPCIYKPIKTQN